MEVTLTSGVLGFEGSERSRRCIRVANSEFHANERLCIPTMDSPEPRNLRLRFNFESVDYWDLKEGEYWDLKEEQNDYLVPKRTDAPKKAPISPKMGYWDLKEETLGFEGRIIGI